MANTLLACGCPCTNSENPCDCCSCITSVKIYSSIDISVSGSGSSPAREDFGQGQRAIAYSFTYTNSIVSVLDIPNGSPSESVACDACYASDFSANASEGGGSLSSDFNHIQTWQRAGGTECPDYATGCVGSPPPGSTCPADVCLSGQVVRRSSAGTGTTETDYQGSNCYYYDGDDYDDHVTAYFCNIHIGGQVIDPAEFSGILSICPQTNLFSLSLSFADNIYNTDIGFSLSTNSSVGQMFGSVVVNTNPTPIPLYISYTGVGGISSKTISGSANIAIEFDSGVVTRDPETGLCPTI